MAPRQEESVQLEASSQQNTRERLAPESSSLALSPVDKAASNTVTAVQVPSPMDGPKLEKAKGNSSSCLDDVRVVADGVSMKKVKRKPEIDLEGTHFHTEKMGSLQGEERPRSLKQSAGLPPKSNLQPASLSEQSS